MLREKQIFLDAIESCPPHAWETYVENACADDQALQARVRALLNAHIESNPLIDGRPVFEIRATTPLLERPGMKIGPFELLKEIGEGGFGIVFLSEQTEPLRRRVALKILKPGLDSRKIVARFEAERQALAMMDHVNIARVLDAGLAPSGRPYFVMDLVDRVSITEYCDNKRLSLEARMQLARDVCIAIQHAHLKGIIHRDLKPNNVMVTEVDGQPVVKVIDFGIAKATSTDATPQTVYSQHVGLMGTPAYMSPEQMSLGAIDVDLRSDVYSLGVLLYELVTGVTPIEEQNCRMDFDQLRQRICEVEAISPSARIAAMPQGAQQRLASTRAVTRLLPQVRNELDWIILKALEKPRERRYQSASDLADDLQRYLNHLPVHAGPPSARYQLQKFARRHFKAIAATTVVILSLALGTVFSVRKAREATQAKIAAVEALELNTKTLVKLRESEKQLQNQLYATRTLEQWQAWHDGDTDRFARLRRRTGSSSNTQLTDDFSNRLVHALSEQPPIVLGEHPADVLAGELSPDGKWFASSDRVGFVYIWDLDQKSLLTKLKYSDKEVTALRFSPDQRLLATAGQDSTIRIWDCSSWTEIRCLRGHARTICSLDWSPNGLWLASGARDATIKIWDREAGTQVHQFEHLSEVVRCVRWSPDAQTLFAAADKTIVRWRTSDWSELSRVSDHPQNILAMACSSDGQLVASAGYDSFIRIYRAADLQPIHTIRHGETTWSLQFAADNHYLLAGLSDGGPMIWQLDRDDSVPQLVRGGLIRNQRVRGLGYSQDGLRLVAALESNRQICLWNSPAIFGYQRISYHDDCIEAHPADNIALTHAKSGDLIVRDLTSGVPRGTLGTLDTPPQKSAFSPSGRYFATVSDPQTAVVWDIRSMREYRRLSLHDNRQGSATYPQLLFSNNDQFLVCAGRFGEGDAATNIQVWNLESGQRIQAMHIGIDDARVAISSRPPFLLFSTHPQGIAEYCFTDSQPTSIRKIHGTIRSLWLDPSDNTLFTAGDSQGVIQWNRSSFEPIQQFVRQRTSIRRFAVSADQQTLATAGEDQVLRLWHIPSGQETCLPFVFPYKLESIKFDTLDRLVLVSRFHRDGPRGVILFDAQQLND